MNSKNDLRSIFDKIYYVNVDKHIERNTEFKKQFDEINPDLIDSGFVQRIDAIKPKDIFSDNIDLLSKITNNQMTKLKHGEIAPWRHAMNESEIRIDHLYELCCSMSHAKLIKEAIAKFQNSGDKEHIVLVLEDDSKINFSKILNSDIFNIKYEKFDVCYAGALLFSEDLSGWLTEREYHIDCSVGENHNMLYNADSGFFGTHGYIIKINQSNIKKFNALINELNAGSIADFCLSSQHYLIKKSVWSFFVDTVNSVSTINPEYSQKIQNATNLNLEKHGLIKNIFQPKSTHPFVNRFDNDKQIWFFIKYKLGLNQTKKWIFTEDDSKIEDLRNYCRKNSDTIQFAYEIHYNDLFRPWYGVKKYIVGGLAT